MESYSSRDFQTSVHWGKQTPIGGGGRFPHQKHLCRTIKKFNCMYMFRWVKLNSNKQKSVNKQISNQACRIALQRFRCGFENTLDEAHFGFNHVRIKRDQPVQSVTFGWKCCLFSVFVGYNILSNKRQVLVKACEWKMLSVSEIQVTSWRSANFRKRAQPGRKFLIPTRVTAIINKLYF